MNLYTYVSCLRQIKCNKKEKNEQKKKWQKKWMFMAYVALDFEGAFFGFLGHTSPEPLGFFLSWQTMFLFAL